ncbi:MAG: filamentous hemagglutinin N-terminal domain-containing protein [Pleurocapsa sp. MO_192.B19]|nr:filamentous hemagglutinin N-terminal domain-containing protein [Pleurocapsa sp. MO_192.B19]
MQKGLSPLFQLSLCTLGCFYATSNTALAQVTPDGTVNTQVNLNGNVAEITGGEARGSNLFHSFQDFSVSTGNEAFFNNATDVSNIFSRVTGGNTSNIDGTIRANGSASLFLINPAGIIFGENTRLDIGGSFYGSGANSILFEDGEFSAADLENPPLLTINPPIGLNLRDNPGNVVNQSVSNNVGLRVNSGETISFTGGEVSFDGGKAIAPGGRVEVLGDKVSLVNNASIDVSSETGGGTALIGGDYQGRDALINARRTYIDDSVKINADAFSNGNGGRVIVWGDEVTGFYGNISARGGDISGNGGFVEVSGKEHLIFRGNVDTTAVNGFTGTLLLDPTNIIIANGSGDEAGDGADTFSGNNSDEAGSILSTPLSEIDDTAPTTIFESELEGLSGDTNVILQATNDITIEDLADDELTFSSGSGVIAFTADADRDGAGDFVMEDSTVVFDEETFNDADTIKTNGRNIAISGANLTLGNINTSFIPSDNAGDTIETAFVVATGSGINVESISGFLSEFADVDLYQIFITGDGTFSASTVDGATFDTQLFLFDAAGFGIYANDDRVAAVEQQSILPANNPLTPVNPGIYYLAVTSNDNDPVSDGGFIFPTATFTDDPNAEIIAEGVNSPTGSGGNLSLIGFDSEFGLGEIGEYTVTLTGVEGTAATFTEANQIAGDSGSITLNATNGNVNLANLDSSNGFGTGGDIVLKATGDITSVGAEFLTISSLSNIADAGAININSSQGSVNLTNFSLLSTSHGDSGIAGDVLIQAGSGIKLTNTEIDAAAFGIDGRTGNITIEALNESNVELISNGEFPSIIFADSFGNIPGEKTGGDLKIIGDQISIDNYELNTSVSGQGNGGDISITGKSVNIQNSSSLATDTSAEGNAGSIFINATNGGNFNLTNNSSITTISNGAGNAGNITVNAGTIFLSEGAEISAEVGEDFSSGDFVDSELFLFDAQGNLLAENDISDPADGAEGSFSEFNSFIEYTFAEDGTYVIGVGAFDSFEGEGGISGNTIAAGQNYTLQVSLENQQINSGTNGLISKIEPNNSTDAAQNINNSFVTKENPNIQDSTSIPNVSISAEGNGTFDYYSFDATAGSLGIFDIDEISTDDTAVQPGNVQAGNINLNATGDITITDNSSVSASTTGRGLGGSINITTPNLLTIRDNSSLEVNSGGQATGGNVVINSGSLNLENEGQISALTASGKGGLLDINVDNTLSMRDNSTISANAGGTGDGGNIEIDAKFVIAYPNQDNDIVTNAQSGNGGNIRITTEALLGLDTRSSIPENTTNDIDVSSQLGLSGDFTINILNVDFVEGITRLPSNVVEPGQITAQTCAANRESTANSGLTINGQGGILPAPDLPLDSQNISINGEINSASAIPQPIETSQGKIQPARGIKLTESGEIILTAYRTNNSGERIPEIKLNCS